MELSELIKKREGLKNRLLEKANEAFLKLQSESISDINSIELDINIDALLEAQSRVERSVSVFNQRFEEYIQSLNDLIADESPKYFQKSEELYQQFLTDDPRYVADRFLFNEYISKPDTKKKFLGRLELYSSWKHPGLIIRPENGDIVEPLKASDPVYILDESKELLMLVKEKWTKSYQDRIRYGYLGEHDTPYIKNLPTNQLGLIVFYHFFNYKPLDVIKQYLHECTTLLKPGGVVVLTYNNCDNPIAVQMVEKGIQTYVPKSILSAVIEGLGFEIIKSFDLEPNVSWLEIKKPGELTSFRGGQALAQIKDSRLDN